MYPCVLDHNVIIGHHKVCTLPCSLSSTSCCLFYKLYRNLYLFFPLHQVSALHCLAFAEYLLAQQLVPEDRVTRTFEMILKDPMDQLVTEGEVQVPSAVEGEGGILASSLKALRPMTNVVHSCRIFTPLILQ